jgi:ferrous iron transport protein A
MINSVENKRLYEEQKPSVSGVKSTRISVLDSLQTSERATVIGLNTSNDLQGRLMGMGLTAGAKVEILQGGRSIFKPLLIAVGDTRIAIGHDLAQMVLVEADEAKNA